MQRFRILAVAVALAALAACGTTKHEHHGTASPIKPPSPEDMAPAAPATSTDAEFDEVKKAAAKQLECPLEKINVVCLRRDADGDCISVRADGCEKSYEYRFGDV